MNFRNLSWILVISVTIFSCSKQVNLVNPEITISPFEPAPLDTITANFVGELALDGEMVEIESYDWKVLDEGNNEIAILSAEGSTMKWVVKDEGIFSIRATVTAGNKSITETKQVKIEHNITSIHKYLAGDWFAEGNADFGGGQEWEAQFTIEENGHYAGHLTKLIKGDISRVFDTGDDNLDHPDKRFEITQIDGNGEALGVVRYVHQDGQLLEFGIKDMVFSNNYDTVNYTVFKGAEIHYEMQRQ
ncbi:MAG: hypothetical protein AB3N14_10620 [Flavobacteriaceae bacterium]